MSSIQIFLQVTENDSTVPAKEELVRCRKCTMYINLVTEDEKYWGRCRVCKTYLHKKCMDLYEQGGFTIAKRKLICFQCISLNESSV